MKLPVLTLVAGLFGATAVSAADLDFGLGDAEFGVNLGLSTLGPTIEPTVRFGQFGLRAPIGAASFDYEEESEGESFEGQFDIGGAGLLADYFPFQNGLFVSGGLIRTDYGIELSGENVEIDGEVSSIDVAIEQKNDVSPMLAMGYTHRLMGRMVLSASAGAILGGGFDFTATDPTGTFTQAEIDEETADLRDIAERLDVVPYLQVSVGFVF